VDLLYRDPRRYVCVCVCVFLQFLRDKYAIPEHYVVAAGDSGNDILMLEGDHPAIVVGNAQVRGGALLNPHSTRSTYSRVHIQSI
jgi:hydroxymethylpyrimidine pyrophosphatase-like HAD family hydrolase